MEYMEIKICMSDKHHRYYKHTKFRQNPRGDPKFLVDLTRNDPLPSQIKQSCIFQYFLYISTNMVIVIKISLHYYVQFNVTSKDINGF